MVKRLLIVAVAMLTVTGGFAQQVQRAPHMQKVKMQRKSPEAHLIQGKVADQPIAKGAVSHALDATPLWYERPTGVYYLGFTEDGQGYYPLMLVAPVNREIEFPYHCKTSLFAKKSWTLNYPDEDPIDISEFDNTEDSVFVWPGMSPGAMYGLPTLNVGVNSYNIGNNNYYLSQGESYFGRLVAEMDVVPFTTFNEHDPQNGYSYYGWSGFNDNHYLFGTGTTDEKIPVIDPQTGDTTSVETVSCPFVYLQQDMGETSGPMYLTNIFMDMLSFSEEPMPEDKELTLYVFNSKTGQVYGKMTCGAADITEDTFGEQFPLEDETYGTVYGYHGSFANWVEDEFGTLEPEPFTVDGPWTIRITGIEQEGVDIGLFGCGNDKATGDDIMAPGYMGVMHPDSSIVQYRFSSNPLSMHFSCNAFYDYADVVSEDSIETEWLDALNVLKVSDDGQTVTNLSYPSMNCAIAFTATPWYGYTYDEEYNIIEYTEEDMTDALYDFGEDVPEWITSISVDPTEWDSETYTPGFTTISVQCEALPAGTETRQAELYIQGRGYTSPTPIIVVQGDATGINSVEGGKVITNINRYNLAGQRVAKNYKGIIIENGKKVVNF